MNVNNMLIRITIDFGYLLFHLLLKLNCLELHISPLADEKAFNTHQLCTSLILEDPGAASRYDAKFSDESLPQEQSALELS